MAGGWSQRIQDRYRVDRELAHRGHVSTWLVTDLRTVSPCVLKVLREAEAPPADARLFEAQARILGGLEHPGLPRLVEHFVEGEGSGRDHVLITRYHPGESLDLLIAKGRIFTEAQALALLRRLATVLAYVHGFDPPLVHRSLKAANVIIGPDGRPCLTDLNFAVEGEGWKAWEETPPDAASLPWAAPEVGLGGAVPASDVYALGLVIIYAMSGQDPVPIAQEGGRQRIREATRASEGFAAVLARMVEPSLERRYPDMRALEAELARLGTGRGPAPQPQNQPVPAPTPVLSPVPGGRASEPRRRTQVRLAVLSILLAVALSALWANRARREEPSGGTLLLPPATSRPTAPAQDVSPAVVPAPPAPVPAEETAAPATAAAPAPSTPGEAALPGQAPAGEAAVPATSAAPPLAPAPADVGPVAVEGRLLFDGQPIARITSLQPSFWFRNEAKRSAEKPEVEYTDGSFRIRGLPAGRMGMSARINLEPATPNLYPGDLDAWTTFAVGEGAPAVLDVNLRKVIHLTQPVDNGAVIRGWDVPCGGGSVHPGRVLFAWEALDPAAKYEVAVERLACGRGYASVGRAFTASTAETWVKVDLEPSAEGECYSFRLTARKDGRTLGMLTTHGHDGMGWDYRFVVK